MGQPAPRMSKEQILQILTELQNTIQQPQLYYRQNISELQTTAKQIQELYSGLLGVLCTGIDDQREKLQQLSKLIVCIDRQYFKIQELEHVADVIEDILASLEQQVLQQPNKVLSFFNIGKPKDIASRNSKLNELQRLVAEDERQLLLNLSKEFHISPQAQQSDTLDSGTASPPEQPVQPKQAEVKQVVRPSIKGIILDDDE